MRVPVVLVALALLGGCVTVGGGGGYTGDGSGSGVQWSGPYGADPYGRGVYGLGRSPYQYGGGYGRSPYYGGGYGRPSGGRLVRPSRNVVCDRATETCYRGREIDASETRDYFGRRAARRVDRVRDQAGTNRIYRVDDDVVCNRRKEVCFKDGRPDRSETRDFFGKKAARRVD